MNPTIVVVGSCMIDLISYADSLPKPGETVHGTSFNIGFGGKGANQCVAAARLGGKTAIVARVGSDTFGDDYIQNFDDNSIDISHVHRTDHVSTGVATITVDKNGQNSIVIVAGANTKMTKEDVDAALPLIKESKVVVCQGEISEEATIAALTSARKFNVQTLMNAAPASNRMNEEIFSLSDTFCVNETEASILSGVEVKTLDDAEDACKLLMKKGCKEVILTLGEQGAYYGSPEEQCHIPSPTVSPVVDTTGAGDSFVGALAYFMAYECSSMTRVKMIEMACKVASTSVQLKGTQTSFLRKDEMNHILKF